MIRCFKNLSQIATLATAHRKDGRALQPDDLSLIKNAAIAFDNNEILWVGETKNLPNEYHLIAKDYSGHVLTPELVDSHTHLIFGGDRAQEYVQRLNGIPYEKIAKSGGGINFTAQETLKLCEDDLLALGHERINRLYSYGVGTIEIKSGYGLCLDGERKISQVIHKLKEQAAPRVQIFRTYLAAHAIPTGTTADKYFNNTVLPLMRELAAAKMIDAVDIFHEVGYFSEAHVRILFTEAKKLGLYTKLHADEFNENNGAGLANEFDSLSADHLLKISPKNIKNMALGNTIATLLPGTAFFLGKPLAPARALLDEGVKVALASDYNPGSCHCDNLLMVGSISCALLKMNQAELWSAMTLNAAHALGLKQQGAIIPKLKPRFSLFKTDSIDKITYHWGQNFAQPFDA